MPFCLRSSDKPTSRQIAQRVPAMDRQRNAGSNYRDADRFPLLPPICPTSSCDPSDSAVLIVLTSWPVDHAHTSNLLVNQSRLSGRAQFIARTRTHAPPFHTSIRMFVRRTRSARLSSRGMSMRGQSRHNFNYFVNGTLTLPIIRSLNASPSCSDRIRLSTRAIASRVTFAISIAQSSRSMTLPYSTHLNKK